MDEGLRVLPDREVQVMLPDVDRDKVDDLAEVIAREPELAAAMLAEAEQLLAQTEGFAEALERYRRSFDARRQIAALSAEETRAALKKRQSRLKVI
ncbi:MAG: hypothetical protein LBR20_06535 [Propionibacteriaceae bacterium]|jgi:hypothetical protein|nr:hypothetical protein [Propionibacteriaceae bacterium]